MSPQALAALGLAAIAALSVTTVVNWLLAMAWRRRAMKTQVSLDHMTRIWDACEGECEQLRQEALVWRSEALQGRVTPGTVPGLPNPRITSRN